MTIKSVFKQDASVMAGLATVGAVYGVYQLNLGNVSMAAASDPNHPVFEASRKKAGYASLILVASLTLITKDANIGILGAGTIIAMEISYRHAIMAHPVSGQMQAPDSSAFQPVEEAQIPYPETHDTMDDYSYAR